MSLFFTNTSYAEKVDIECNVFDINTSHTSFLYNDVSIKVQFGKMWPFLWTGKEFLTSGDIDKKYFHKSSDLSEWEDFCIEDELREKIFSGMYLPEIQFVGGKYIAYNAVYFDPSAGVQYLKYNGEQNLYPILVLDEDFNLLYEHMFDEPMMGFGYADGIYYVKTGYCYADENENIKYETKIYVSKDALDWAIDETIDEIPLSNGVKNNLDIHTKFVYRSGAVGYRFEMDNLMISNEKLDKTTVLYEKVPECQYKVIDDLYVAFQEGARTFSVSLDGVYWLQIDMPTYAGDYETLYDCYWWKDKLVFRLGYRLLEYDLAEIRAVLNEKCPIDAPYIELNDNILGFETAPQIEDGRTLVPMRFLFEQIGADVKWDGATKTATASLDNTAVTFSIDNTAVKINNAPAKMDVPARLINDKTMVPLRFLSEELGYDVKWDEDTRVITIE